ncbi:MAG: IS110 family transposase [Acidobacteria bacterium]|nr:IS110 family transposase [Acidobacteriota bacterium]
MTLYIGVDFHPHQQTVSYCCSDEAEVHQTSLAHNVEQVHRFYRQLPKAVVGIEASCTAQWFEQMLLDLGHELRVGNPSQIRARARSRHKSDKRDADLLLDLLLKDEFPALWRRSMPGQSVLEQLRFRHHLVKHRTQICNRLQALAHAAGLPKKGIQTKRARIALMAANFTETQSFQRNQLFELLDDLTERIKEVEKWLEDKAAGDAKVQLLLTHKGIGLLGALAVVHTLGDINRFPSSKEAVAYTGLDPLEQSSAGKVRYGSISKAGSSVLRHLLGQAMHVAARYDGQLKTFYQRLASRRTKSIAKVAATRKLLIRLFIMLRDEIDYSEFKRRGSEARMPAVSHGLQ